MTASEPITLYINASVPGLPISPLIYGINSNDPVARPWIPFSRLGGNRLTAYNWENNASNAGSDWKNQNDGHLGGGDKPGEVVRSYLEGALSHDHHAIITIPMAGYVAADKLGDGDVNQTPDFLAKRFVPSHAKKKTPFVYPPDLTDGAVFQDELVWWVNREFATSHERILYGLDNEPDLWDGTHSRIRTERLTYAELVQRTTDTAAAIKDVVPTAVVFGFVSYGYAGFTSLQWAPDNNDRDFINFFLDQMQAAETAAGRRLVDVLDLHWYPEAYGGGHRITDRGDHDTALARVQAPRSLWDPTYTEDSWIARNLQGPIHLLPRLKAQIDQHYPGTKLAFTEYDYGGADQISGAVAQADVLGILGEQGVFAASLWGGGPFHYAAFEAYLNYDGKGGQVGDLGLPCTSSVIADVSLHASRYAGDANRLSVVLINRAEASRTCTLAIDGFNWTSGSAWRITGENPNVRALGLLANTGSIELPAMSVTTLVLQQEN